MAVKPHLQTASTPAETRAIAKDAYIYGYPMVQVYLTMYAFSIDKHNPQYKGPFNAPLSFARVFTPDDSAFVTPNSDTPYTFLSLDLRAEPIVLIYRVYMPGEAVINSTWKKPPMQAVTAK